MSTTSSVKTFIPLSVPQIEGREWEYVRECLDTGWVSSVGAFVDRFEAEFAAYVGSTHAIGTSCGTAALHVMLLLAGVKPGDRVLVPSLTFLATANAVSYAGATPLFVDADPATWQMDPVDGRKALTEARDAGERVGAIMPAHLLGSPADVTAWQALAAEFSVPLVHDAAEGLGTTWGGKSLSQQGDLAAYSFNGNKIITTGGGGMITTDDPDLARRAKHLTTTAKTDAIEFIHDEVGFNYRLTNVLAAMGCAQLEMLPEFLDRKRRFAARYTEALRDIPGVRTFPEPVGGGSSYWLYTIQIDAEEFGGSSRDLLRHLESESIQTRPLWQPGHLSPAYQATAPRACPVADRLNQECLSLPCSTGLTDDDQERVITAIRAFAG